MSKSADRLAARAAAKLQATAPLWPGATWREVVETMSDMVEIDEADWSPALRKKARAVSKMLAELSNEDERGIEVESDPAPRRGYDR